MIAPEAHTVRRLDLFVTEACNLACDYCFAAGRRRGTLALRQALGAIDWLMDSHSDRAHITFWGGEPLLRLDLLQQASIHARDAARQAGKRLTFSMPTNATLLDEHSLRWIADNQVEIFLSIDGDVDSQGRPLVAGGSSSALAHHGLQRALASPGAGTPAVRMTVTPGNAAGQARGATCFLRHGVRELLVYPAMDQPWSEHEVASFASGQLELADLLIEAVHQAETPTQIPRLKAWLPTLRRLLPSSPRRRRAGPPSSCAAGSALVALDVDGCFAPCHRFVFYNRSRQGPQLGTLEQGLDLRAAEPLRRLGIQDQRSEEGQRCVDCELFDLCGYGCPAISFAVTGDFATVPRAACALMRGQAAACRRVHDALFEDPRYRVYLGQPLQEALRCSAQTLAQEAWQRLRQEDGTSPCSK